MADDQEQWINLEKHNRYLDNEVTSEAFLGPVHFEVTFKKTKLSNFKVRVHPLGGEAKYSKKERRRNRRFRLKVVGSATNEGNKQVKLTRDVTFPAAGGNRYRIEAKHKGKIVESEHVRATRRKLFYHVMRMQGVSAFSTQNLEEEYWNPEKRYYIKLKREPGGVETVAREPVFDHNVWFPSAKRAWKLKKYKPYAFALCFVEYIAESEEIEISDDVPSGVPSRLVAFVAGREVIFEVGYGLWTDLRPADDGNKFWWVSGDLHFLPEGQPPSAIEQIAFGRDDVEAIEPNEGPYGGKTRIRIRIPAGAVRRNLLTRRRGTWYLDARVRVASFSNGFAYSRIAAACIARRVSWDDMPDHTTRYTLNHEIGHVVGMVADGAGLAPDTHADFYDANWAGHVGPHCKKSMNWNGARWVGAPGCVMFGANGVYDMSGNLQDSPETYCADCAPIVRRLDLGKKAVKAGTFGKTLDEM